MRAKSEPQTGTEIDRCLENEVYGKSTEDGDGDDSHQSNTLVGASRTGA